MKTFHLIACSLFAALTAVLSQIVLPVGPVPVNLATFSVLLSGLVLGARLGALSQLVYVLLGAIGIPVFTMFRGGLGVLAGPTGGYIAGYVLGAGAAGFLAQRYGGKVWGASLALICGYLTYTALGTGWFMISAHSALIPALMACVIPFIPGDIAKMALAAVLARRLRGSFLKLGAARA